MKQLKKEDLIGLEQTKRKLDFLFQTFDKTGIFPNTLLVGPKGTGKTTVAHIISQNLKTKSGKKRNLIEVNCSTLASVSQFFEHLVIPYLQDTEVTVLMDEASELKREISMAFLSILSQEGEQRTFYHHGDSYVFDFKKLTFVFATSEPHKMFHALKDRLEKIYIEPFTGVDLAAIVSRRIMPYTLDPLIIDDVASHLRGNPRHAVHTATHIKRILEVYGEKVLNQKRWDELKNKLAIFPLGLNSIEISVLEAMRSANIDLSLTALSAHTGMTPQSLRQEIEPFLMRNNLIEVRAKGRGLTANGVRYVNKLQSTVP